MSDNWYACNYINLFSVYPHTCDACSYMESFNAGTAGGDQLVLPSNVLERWFKRFEDKFRRDPDFLVRHGQVA